MAPFSIIAVATAFRPIVHSAVEAAALKVAVLEAAAPKLNLRLKVVVEVEVEAVIINMITITIHTTDTALVVAVVNPTSLAQLKPPSERGAKGADIVCGEGQPLGAPLSSGGPYYGFLTCKMPYVRLMPGRIIGRTVDIEGKPGFTLTLQAREQHIRRSKATSNICTNQGLLVTASTIYMSLLGPDGLAKVASASMANTAALIAKLTTIPGVSRVFDGQVFHEAVIRLPKAVAPVLEALADEGVLGGFDLSRHNPELGHALLVCATETKSEAQLDRYADTLRRLLAA